MSKNVKTDIVPGVLRKMVFSVYDSKAKVFFQPFIMKTKGEAIRGFIDIVNDQNTQIAKHPEDYTLFCLGEFDEESGVFINLTANESLGCAIEFKENKI